MNSFEPLGISMKQNLFQGAFSMLNFKKLFLGLLFSVLFSAVLIAVCAFMILKLGFLPSEPCAWHALCSFLCCDKRYAVCKYAGCTSCYTERNICNMQRMRWSNGRE